jgi:putative SOS response-associated peptidase YedK
VCNLYSLTKGQAAIVALVRAMRDRTGNLPPMPGIFPDFPAPIAHNAPDGARELAMAHWGDAGPAGLRRRADHQHTEREEPALAGLA